MKSIIIRFCQSILAFAGFAKVQLFFLFRNGMMHQQQPNVKVRGKSLAQKSIVLILTGAIVVVLAGFYSFNNPSNNEAVSAPNIIYILADDLGYGDVNFEIQGLNKFSNPFIKTPKLARLAQQSVVFTNDLSEEKPSLFEYMVFKLEEMYEDVNIDRVESAKEMKARFN